MSFAVQVDLSNPAQLLACGGLLEAAHRFWLGHTITGSFVGDNRFKVEAPGTEGDVMGWLCSAQTPPAAAKSPKSEPKAESKISASAGGTLLFPSHEEWRLTDWSGEDLKREKIKTFAGKQIGSLMLTKALNATRTMLKSDLPLFDRAQVQKKGDVLFGMDVRSGRSALEIGYSPDALGSVAKVYQFPAVELLAALGVQTFRPLKVGGDFLFGVWRDFLPVELARAAASCAELPCGLTAMKFQLIGRKERGGSHGEENDQYKCFTRAIPQGADAAI